MSDVSKKVEESKTDVSNRRALRPGEWACVDARCAHINAEKRHSCEICGKAKPKAKSKIGREIGKDAAEKSKGLFSAEVKLFLRIFLIFDWVCTKCGNVNWARRNTCNVCNAPKLADLEIRTGYGGGYMDRQDVEYKDRRDDEEEFDEFGRKKKKRNAEHEQRPDASLSEEPHEETLSKCEDPKKAFEDDDDNEDEESDDGDLDKYDLTADPELIAFTAALESSKIKTVHAAGVENRPPSSMSSDCTCSCSGGDCSCIESEEEEISAKKIRSDRAEGDKRRSVDRDRRHNRDRRDEKDRKEDRDEANEKSSASRNKDRDHRDRRSRERSRERRRSRERDHRR